MASEWLDLYLDTDGVLVDEHGDPANALWPSFHTVNDADSYLDDNDIRASCVEWLDHAVLATSRRRGN